MKIDQETWDEARVVFFKILNDWENQDPHIKAQMKTMGETIMFDMTRLNKENQNDT